MARPGPCIDINATLALAEFRSILRMNTEQWGASEIIVGMFDAV
jgi:hypothetical protein